jgi:hypothetical protein
MTLDARDVEGFQQLMSHPDDMPARQDKRPLGPAAERALAEAAIRRAEIDRKAAARPKEHNGRDGPDPVRYGDWEVGGLASDF